MREVEQVTHDLNAPWAGMYTHLFSPSASLS